MSATTTLIGRLVKDIEIKQSNNNKEYGLIRLAVRRKYKNQDGEYPTDFFVMPVFNKNNISSLKKYTTKGSLIAVHGTLETNQTTDNEQTRTYINIIPNDFIFLATPKSSEDNQEPEFEMPIRLDNYPHEEPEFQNEVPNYVVNTDEHPFL